MTWGEVELEPEVEQWFLGLSAGHRGTVAFYVDLLAAQGPLLSEPYSRQLNGKLRELRFHLDTDAVRITYWIASGRRIILLTAFRKRRMRETAEVARARRALVRCVEERHTVDEV
ncbi:type II toxin-antitoxin system RelE/ParE family toxin [Streptomyces sp. NPDC013978]|uniref:type II toxin-antitoxin system RelE/ParE family toxin n=1 Tax=Streptomyces TaxID=1883 RepID=UPI001EFA42C6|nr:type II toxin-antitoxin system RelE/ParE family toxin [Streptomyces deccanensis]ULR51391.1 type II toxin-antitoxin system RelE/ParE family toxin [Streptomyces deccanensis]